MPKYMVASDDFFTIEFFNTYGEAIGYCSTTVDCGDEAYIYKISDQWKYTIPESTLLPTISQNF